MSEVIEWVLVMDVREGQSDKVQPLIDEMSRATESDEPGTLHYEYYMNADRTRCTVLERYADNAAVMVHLGNFAAKFAESFFAVFAPVSFTVYGEANEDVRAALAQLGATHENRVAGFHR